MASNGSSEGSHMNHSHILTLTTSLLCQDHVWIIVTHCGTLFVSTKKNSMKCLVTGL